jgi:hypothetical protein
MEIPISMFQVLHDITLKYRIRQTEWAKAADGMPETRISDFIKMSRGIEVYGRQFTVSKFYELYMGLRKIIGGTTLKKELMERLDKEKNIDVQLILLVTQIFSETNETKELAKTQLKMVLKSAEA